MWRSATPFMLISITYYLELHCSIFFTYIDFFDILRIVYVLQCLKTIDDLVGKYDVNTKNL